MIMKKDIKIELIQFNNWLINSINLTNYSFIANETEKINGKKVNITGAFIANLAENIREMSEGDDNWSVEDTISLIKESYKGFYSSQIEKEKQNLGFKL